MRFKHSLFPEMGEEFPSRNILHIHIEMSCVLSKSFEVYLRHEAFTIKGWDIVLRILYSLEM